MPRNRLARSMPPASQGAASLPSMLHTRRLLCGGDILAGSREEIDRGLIVERRRVGEVDDDVGVLQRIGKAFTRQRIAPRARHGCDHLMPAFGQFPDDFRTDSVGQSSLLYADLPSGGSEKAVQFDQQKVGHLFLRAVPARQRASAYIDRLGAPAFHDVEQLSHRALRAPQQQ